MSSRMAAAVRRQVGPGRVDFSVDLGRDRTDVRPTSTARIGSADVLAGVAFEQHGSTPEIVSVADATGLRSLGRGDARE